MIFKYEELTSEIIKFNIVSMKSTIDHKMKKQNSNTNYDSNVFQLSTSGIVQPTCDDSNVVYYR